MLASLILASVVALFLAWLSSAGGTGGGILMMAVFVALFGLQIAIPVITLTQLASNGGRVWFNRAELDWQVGRWHALGSVPFAIAGGLYLAHAPVEPLKRVLGVVLLLTVMWRRLRPHAFKPQVKAFAVLGSGTALVSSLLGAVGPIAAPFFLAYGLTGGAFIGTEALTSLVVHLAKVVAYGSTALLSHHVLLLSALLAPSILVGTWLGKKTIDRLSKRTFILVTEAGMVVAGVLFLLGG